jgi:hypothetical protein
VLQFKVESASGAAIKAVLDCDSKEIATWDWPDLKDSQTIEYTLIDKGTYTLTIMAAYTALAGGTSEVAVSINDKKTTFSLFGQPPDIGKSLAVVIVR